MTRIRLGTLRALAGDWTNLHPWLADREQITVLGELEQALNPHLRVVPQRTRSARVLRQALRELNESIVQFNRRWEGFVSRVHLSEVNALRENYNRYFVLEKECVVRSLRIASQGFRPLTPLTRQDLFRLLPLLPIISLAK